MGRKLYLEVEIHEDADSTAELEIMEAAELDGVIQVRDITSAIDSVLESQCGLIADRKNLKEVGEYASSFTSPEEGLIAYMMTGMTINTICRLIGYPTSPLRVVEEVPSQ